MIKKRQKIFSEAYESVLAWSPPWRGKTLSSDSEEAAGQLSARRK